MARILNFKIPTYDDVAIEENWFSNYGVYVAGTDGIRLSVLPSNDVISTKIVGNNGEAFVSSSYNKREIYMPMYIKDIDTLDEFKKLIIFDKPKWFYFKNSETKIKGIVSGEILVRPHGREGTFEMTVTCPEPYFYESFPFESNILNPVSLSFFNRGNVTSSPIYEITGKGMVHLGVNGTVASIQFSNSDYETLVLDTRFMELRKGNGENRLFSNTNFVFPKMKAGENAIAVNGDCINIKIIPNSVWI